MATAVPLLLALPTHAEIPHVLPAAESYFLCNGQKKEAEVFITHSRHFISAADGGSFFCSGTGSAVNRNPFVHVQADVHGGSRGGLSVQADIEMVYSFAVHEKRKPPRPNKVIPQSMSVTGRVESSAAGTTNRASFISIYANLSYQPPVLVAAIVGNGVRRETEPVPISSAPDDLMRVRYFAQCYLSVGKDESDSCVADADPLPTFDQARFDADNLRLGLSTFMLSDYYEYRFSPGMIPEPATWLTGLAGLVALATRLAARPRRMSPDLRPGAPHRSPLTPRRPEST